MSPNVPSSEPQGAYFAPVDQAGFWRRLIASTVDGLVLYFIWALVYVIWLVMAETPGFDGRTIGPAGMLALYLYLGPLKRSRLRTVGYRVAGVRLVNIRGGRPSLAALALRGGLYMLGSFAVLDFLWFLAVRRRQKLSDQLAGTYVVRSHSQPAGRGPVIVAYYAGFGYFLVMNEVDSRADLRRKEGA